MRKPRLSFFSALRAVLKRIIENQRDDPERKSSATALSPRKPMVLSCSRYNVNYPWQRNENSRESATRRGIKNAKQTSHP